MNFETAPSSGDPETDSLADRRWVTAGAAISFSFPSAAAQFTGYSGGEPSSNFEALNATQQAAARAALAQIAAFTNLTFTELTGADAANATMRFGMTDDTPTAHAYLPSATEQGGDVWFRNAGGDYDDPVRGNYAWFTFAHEIGHALGLTHPHESTPPMVSERDSMQFTVMSYRSYTYDDIEGYTNKTWGFSQSFMAEDIAALQFLYGANFNHNSGDSLYQWSPITGEMSINGVGQGAAGDNVIFLTVWDGGGIDTFDLSNHVIDTSVFYNPTLIDLRPGAGTFLQGQHADLGTGPFGYNFFVAYLYNGDTRSLIENVVGTNGRDTIHGNDAANHIDGHGGGDGSDEIFGYGGDDVLVGGGFLYGGDGNDTLSGGGTMQGGAGNDLLYGGGWLEGNDGDDTMFAAASNDSLKGGVGNDILHGEGGYDTLEGGDGWDTLYGGDGIDMLYGGAGNDTLLGEAGNDTLDGEGGNDLLKGGLGDDLYYVNDTGDQVVEFDGEGIDTIQTSISLVAPDAIENLNIVFNGGWSEPLPLNLTGNALDNMLVGNSAANILDGGAGADKLFGGLGDDTYYVDNPNDMVTDFEGGGTDTVYSSVSYVLANTPPAAPPVPGYDPYAGPSLRYDEPKDYAVEILILTGTANVNGTGSEIGNRIEGNPGANVLDGRAGADTLVGRGGNDSYMVDNAGDVVIEAAGEGTDRVYSAVSYALAAGASVETLSTTNAFGTAAIALRGNELANTVYGNYGNNTLYGGAGNDALYGYDGDDTLVGDAGADSMAGGLGNDGYLVDNAGDTAAETAGQGTDRVYASVSYTLTAGASIETLSTDNALGTAAINLTGNELANTVYGNYGANALYGGAGNDALYGYDGDDVLIGGAGADRMTGGLGNDGYLVDSAGDTVAETAGQGSDRVYAGLTYTLAAGASVETLSTDNALGTAAINLTGNELANTIYGNYGTNVLYGGAGNDALYGYDGNDTLVGGTGADTMAGGLGDDGFLVDNAGDLVVEAAGQGADRVYAGVSYALPAGLSVEVLSTDSPTGTAAINLTGNELANTLFGNYGANVLSGGAGNDALYGYDGNDTLNGGLGGDAMVGGLGNDGYLVDNAGDTIAELAGQGTDRVYSAVSYALAAGVSVEILSTTDPFGTAAIALRGNELANTLYGNSGNNTLMGGLGADGLYGYAGNDAFRFDSALGGGNIDTIGDYVVADDVIQLDDAVFAGLGLGVLAAGAFATGAAAAEADDRIIYNAATGALLFDADGVGGAAAIQFATLSTGLAMTNAEFLVI